VTKPTRGGRQVIQLNTLTSDELHALWDALQQYVDNNDPAEVEDHHDRRLPTKYRAAERLLESIDRYVSRAATDLRAGALDK
jgi:RNAse (barnase) inhibitor barstar